MSFASGYLAKQVIRDRLISTPPDPGCGMIVTIPVFREEGLLDCLKALQKNTAPPVDTEVLLFFNAPSDADEASLELNRRILAQAVAWIEKQEPAGIRFHVYAEEKVMEREAGAGLARKILMDEAVRRFSRLNKEQGVILSLDADTLVEENYLAAVFNHFKTNPATDGCSLLFEHPLSGSGFSSEIYEAITSYELHQRYYLHALRSTGYPFAYHTVGSAFAVRAGAYVSQGGMNRRQAGEDFYFIQKLAKTGRFTECRSVTVHPSPRPSDRVPFGTGPAIKSMLEKGSADYFTNPLYSFAILGDFFSQMSALHSGEKLDFHPLLQNYLENAGYEERVQEIRENTGSEISFRKRFFQWFDGLEILKFLHYARDNGISDKPVREEALLLLHQLAYPYDGGTDALSLLKYFRGIDRGLIYPR